MCPKYVSLFSSLVAPTKGITILSKLLQPENALKLIFVTYFGIIACTIVLSFTPVIVQVFGVDEKLKLLISSLICHFAV